MTTNDPEVARMAQMFRSHGEEKKYMHQIPGLNFRMHGFQGAALTVKLPLLDGWNQRRVEIAEKYREAFADLPLILPAKAADRTHVYHQFVVRLPNRDAFREHLAGLGISTGLHYPTPIHLTPAYAHLGYTKGDFPIAEELADTHASLPIFAEMTDAQVDRVIAGIKSFF